jgi:hypothetical protein
MMPAETCLLRRQLRQRAGAEEPEHVLLERVEPPLHARLEHLLRRAQRRLGDRLRVGDGVRERGLAVDVLARLQRREHEILVLVSRRRDEDRLDRLVVEHAAEVLLGRRLRVALLRALVDALVGVTHRLHVRAGDGGERLQDVAPLVAEADHRDRHRRRRLLRLLRLRLRVGLRLDLLRLRVERVAEEEARSETRAVTKEGTTCNGANRVVFLHRSLRTLASFGERSKQPCWADPGRRYYFDGAAIV